MCEIMEGYLAEARAEARAETRTETKAEIIVNLLSEGLSLEKIAALTNTDLAFVQEVAAKTE